MTSDIVKALVIVAVISILLLVGVVWVVEKMPASPTKNKYKICSSGFGATCIYTNKYEEKDSCAISEDGEKKCGTYSIKENK